MATTDSKKLDLVEILIAGLIALVLLVCAAGLHLDTKSKERRVIACLATGQPAADCAQLGR